MNFKWIVYYVTAAWALVQIYWKIFDTHGMLLELWAPELFNIYTCHFDCLYEFYQHYDWWTWLLSCVLCLCIRDRGWLLYVPNVVFIFVDGMRCVYLVTDVSTLAVCYFIYYRDIIFSVEWREFCTVFLFLHYLHWQCHTDKGRELLARNMRGKCASSFRSGNAVINKLVPLLKDNTSSIEQVTDYITNLEHHMSSIVQSYSEFKEKFADDLDTLADFHK